MKSAIRGQQSRRLWTRSSLSWRHWIQPFSRRLLTSILRVAVTPTSQAWPPAMPSPATPASLQMPWKPSSSGRYAAEFVPPGSLVFGISNSGKATRSVEALVNARLGGARTVAITGNAEGWLAQEADTILDQSVRLAGELIGMPSNLARDTDDDRPRRGSFGLVNYLASLTTLYLIAFQAGVVRGRLSEARADSLRVELRSASELIAETVRICTPAAEAYAEQVKDIESYTILGSGPSIATSLFYAAKTYELPRVYGVSQELEECGARAVFPHRRRHAGSIHCAPGSQRQQDTRALTYDADHGRVGRRRHGR